MNCLFFNGVLVVSWLRSNVVGVVYNVLLPVRFTRCHTNKYSSGLQNFQYYTLMLVHNHYESLCISVSYSSMVCNNFRWIGGRFINKWIAQAIKNGLFVSYYEEFGTINGIWYLNGGLVDGTSKLHICGYVICSLWYISFSYVRIWSMEEGGCISLDF